MTADDEIELARLRAWHEEFLAEDAATADRIRAIREGTGRLRAENGRRLAELNALLARPGALHAVESVRICETGELTFTLVRACQHGHLNRTEVSVSRDSFARLAADVPRLWAGREGKP